jgi:hypothetical protein
MFYVDGKKQKIEFVDYMRSLNIVPVSISYELDPTDKAKARELYEKSVNGSYEKGEFEDIESIVAASSARRGGYMSPSAPPSPRASAIRTSWRRSSTRRSGAAIASSRNYLRRMCPARPAPSRAPS